MISTLSSKWLDHLKNQDLRGAHLRKGLRMAVFQAVKRGRHPVANDGIATWEFATTIGVTICVPLCTGTFVSKNV